MRRMPRVALACWLCACGAAAPASVSPPHPASVSSAPTPSTTTYCEFSGPLHAILRSPSGFPFAALSGADSRAELVRREDGSLGMTVEVDHREWHLRGRVDFPEDVALRWADTAWLGAGVGVVSGDPVEVLDARPGEALVSPRAAARQRVRVLDASRWVPCDTLVLEQRIANRAAIDAVLGPTAASGTILYLRGAVSITETPDGAAFAELPPGPPVYANLVEQTATHRRIELGLGRGRVVGWVPNDVGPLRAIRFSDEMVVIGMMTDHRCSTGSRTTLGVASGEGMFEDVGWIDPDGVFLELGDVRGDGTFTIVDGNGPVRMLPGVAWIGLADPVPTCTGHLSPPPSAPDTRGTVDRVLRATLTTSADRALTEGITCEVTLSHPSVGAGRCSVGVRCGMRTLYGGSGVSCSVADDGAVTATDPVSTSVDGTPALTLDLRGGVASVIDDDSARRGEMHVELAVVWE